LELAKSISVIIPNYNGSDLLREYVPCNLEVLAAIGADYEIIIVDDASEDNSVEFIRATYPGVKLIVNPENKGFSYCYNRGTEAARYELILLLNADVKLTAGYFDQKWKYFLRWDTFGVIGRIVDMEGDHIQEGGRIPKLSGFMLKTDYCYYSKNEKDRLYTFYLSGANALIHAEKLRQIGGFYELFSPFCGGDIELSMRAWRLKWKCYYEHQAVCRRRATPVIKNGGTENGDESVSFRNRFYLHAIHLNGFALLAWHCQVTLTVLLPGLLIGQTGIWKSYRELFANRKIIKQYKEQINELTDKNDSHVTIFNAVSKIRKSVKNKKYSSFKS
jgi:GT2 family glycosyltransferase